MRICCYTSTALPKIGGQELVVDSLAQRFVHHGHDVVVLAPRPRDGAILDSAALPYKVAWHPRFHSTRWFVAWYGRWLARLHKRWPFDVLHCHDVYPSGYVAARCAAIAGLPLVITSHGCDLDPDSLLVRKPALKDHYLLALRRAGAVVAISEFTEGHIRELCPGVRIERIPNGVGLRQFSESVPRPAELDAAIRPGEYFLYLGRLERRKGADLLLEAFSRMALENRMQLVIAGEGPQRAVLESRAAELRLLGMRVWLAGRLTGDTKTWLLQNSRCGVVPSRLSEAFGVVVLENHAAGRPVIAARLPGLAGLVEPNRTGWLVPPDAPEELAAALRRAAREPDQLHQMGRAGRCAVQDYDWSGIVARHLALFEDLIARSAGRCAA